jgi:hypothetical protein
MTETLHPQVASLAEAYARDLARCIPSSSLDARVELLVATPRKENLRAPPPPRAARTWVRWAAAACVGTLAVAAGVIIGVRVERAGAPVLVTNARDSTWPPPDFPLWPTDSVALKIPAEISSHGTLVAVNGKTRSAGTRYWVDVVVSNDGTVRIENVVPAGENRHGIDTQSP